MHIPQVGVLLSSSMNLHPIRAAIPIYIDPDILAEMPAHPTTEEFTPSNIDDFKGPTPTAAPPSTWDFTHGFPISWTTALALDIFVLILVLSALFLVAYLVRRHYQREKLRRLIASVHERPSAADEYDMNDSNSSTTKTLASRLKMGNPLTKMRTGREAQKNHARWGSDATWSAEIGKIGFEGLEEKGKAKISMEDGGGLVDWNAKVLVTGDEKQTRKNLRGSGHDAFRGT